MAARRFAARIAETDGVVLEITDLHAGYGEVPVLRGVSLQLHEGEAIGIVGHNGMGKTTLLQADHGLVAGDRRQDRGRRRRRDRRGRRMSAAASASPTCRKAAASFRA